MTYPDHASFTRHAMPSDRLNAAAKKLMPAVYDAAHDAIAAAYPAHWCQFGHHLSSHPLLERAAIAMLARQLPAQNVVIAGAKADVSPADIGAQIERAAASIMLTDIDCDPRYDALMRDVLTELKPVIKAATGAMRAPSAALIIAAPNSVQPLRFDAEFTVHFQLSGSRSITRFPTADQSVIGPEYYEQALFGGHADGTYGCSAADLAELMQLAQRHDPAPGEALYIPAFSPHQVRVHDEASVSLALSWQSRRSRHFAEACQFNARLRAMGAHPEPARPFPARNWARSYAWRAWQQWDWAKDRLRREKAAWK